ncbi:hypothetical protein R3P38DRAFT_2860027 [Favolaschia claudopus]|uniref:Uncharacterized protein n=1 Tax=Favolaschia claudopus TaxID=2862362 RepID=A0AAW0DMT3_9AGAR
MMFNVVALFALVNAALVSSTAIRADAAPAVAHKATGPIANAISPIANAIVVFQTCVDENLKNCLIWSATTLPVGCSNTASSGQANSISSVQTAAGVGCTLFTSTTCSGQSQFINGTLNALTVVGFDNKANSFTCASL